MRIPLTFNPRVWRTCGRRRGWWWQGGGGGGVLFDLRLKVEGWVGVWSAIGEFMAMNGNGFCALIDYGSERPLLIHFVLHFKVIFW